MAKRKGAIQRRIYFHRLAHAESVLPLLGSDIKRIENLPFEGDGSRSRYLRDGDDRLFVHFDSVEYPIRIRFSRTRLHGLPTKESSGKLEDLGLHPDQGLAETTHAIIFANGYVASEFNAEAPRLKKLGDYLFAKKSSLVERPIFLPLFQKDVIALIEATKIISTLELNARPQASALLAQADEDLASAFEANRRLGANKTIHWILRAENHQEGGLWKLARRLARLVVSERHDAIENIRTLRVKGHAVGKQLDEIDLLEDHLIAVKQFERSSERSRALAPDLAYAKLEEAYNERREELSLANAGKFAR